MRLIYPRATAYIGGKLTLAGGGFLPGVEYVKVKALVIEPLMSPRAKKKVGKMGVDGEILPPTAVQVEVHQALLSLFHPCC